ncbi:hypothetical protein Pfo_022492 [Paulownia fortunei]|nr:hypothetical protein Pfo_022492 [Paulownia fortunei]
MVKRPAFFKFFIPDNSTQELKIPSVFIRSLQGAWPENVALRDRYNNLWQVKVEKSGDNWYFKDGWTKFVEDNLIKGGEILVYEYFCEGLFDVKIFGSSACEEKGIGGPICKNTEKEDKMTEAEDEDGDETDDHDFVCMIRQENQRDDGRGEQVMDGGTASSENPHGNKRNFDWYGAEIFKSGLVPQPVNPYFVTKTRSRSSELYIPMDVVKHFSLELPEVIMFFDPSGRQFRAKRKMWKDGRMFYSKGWKSLCKMNLVEKDDKCICEFVHGGGGNIHISVSFVRANRH